jgi:hypothetical protein
MKKSKIAFRGPILPVIIISNDRLYAGYNLKSLNKYLGLSIPTEGEDFVKMIDSDAEEFWFIPEHMIMTPGITIHGWTKKQIINLFNNSTNSEELGIKYPLKSLSNKRLSSIIKEICELIKSHNKSIQRTERK